MDEYRTKSVEELGEEFRITDDKMAEWALRKIKEATEERNRLVKDAEDEIDYYSELIRAADKRRESNNGYLKGKLLEYFHTVPHKDSPTQESYKLPSGSLVEKKPKLVMNYEDGALLEWLKGAGMKEYIKTTEKPFWADFKKSLTIMDGKAISTETGEEVPCIEVTEEPEKFEVKV